MLAPVIVFVYNRPYHTKKTMEALKKNTLAKDTLLYIFSDAAKNEKSKAQVEEVRKYIKTIKGFKEVVIKEAPYNRGLANSVINGVNKILDKHGKVIVLEDDLITSNNFLEFMNDALESYRNRRDIWSISGFSPAISIPKHYEENVYLSNRSSSWGWATWRDRWEKIDWEVEDYNEFKKNIKLQKRFNRGGNDLSDLLMNQKNGLIDSWAIRWCYSQFKDESYSVFPIKSKIKNIGNDGSGVHCSSKDVIEIYMDDGVENTVCDLNVKPNQEILSGLKRYYDKDFRGKVGIFLRKICIYNLIKRILKR